MNITFVGLILSISLMLSLAQAQNTEIERSSNDQSLEDHPRVITEERFMNEIQKDSVKEMLMKDPKEKKYSAKIAKVCFRNNVLCYIMPLYLT
jgi:hypothetical protein